MPFSLPFLAWVLQGIPETIAVMALTLVLATGKLNWYTIIQLGIAQAIITYFIRLVPFTPGIHTIVMLTTTIVIINITTDLSFPIAAISTTAAIIALMLFEMTLVLTLKVASVPDIFELIEKSIWVRILLGYPQVLFLFGLALLIDYKKYPMYKKIEEITTKERH